MTKKIPNDHYTGALLEDLHHKFDALLEAFSALRKEMTTKMVTKEELAEVKDDVKIIKAAVTATNHQVNDHETRIRHLESRAV